MSNRRKCIRRSDLLIYIESMYLPHGSGVWCFCFELQWHPIVCSVFAFKFKVKPNKFFTYLLRWDSLSLKLDFQTFFWPLCTFSNCLAFDELIWNRTMHVVQMKFILIYIPGDHIGCEQHFQVEITYQFILRSHWIVHCFWHKHTQIEWERYKFYNQIEISGYGIVSALNWNSYRFCGLFTRESFSKTRLFTIYGKMVHVYERFGGRRLSFVCLFFVRWMLDARISPV